MLPDDSKNGGKTMHEHVRSDDKKKMGGIPRIIYIKMLSNERNSKKHIPVVAKP